MRQVDRRVTILMLEARALFYEVMLFLRPCAWRFGLRRTGFA
jgi:hypothetical protein